VIVERFQVVVSRAAVTNPPNQDVMTYGIHFVRRTTLEGSTATGMDNTLRAAVEARWDTFYAVCKAQMQSWAQLTELRWYDGWPTADPPVPPVRVQSRSVTGSAGAAAGLPPQCAINCTLETMSRRHWGRFALGGFAATTVVDDKGLVQVGVRTSLATALAAFLNGCLTDGAAPVVYRRPRFSYDSHHHRTGLLEPPTYRPVISCRIDDVVDTVRRRRFEHTSNRSINALTVPTAQPAVYGQTYNDVQG